MPRIAQAMSPEEKEAIYRFRYEHHFRKLGPDMPGVDHQARLVREPHDDASTHFFVQEPHGDITAVATVTPLSAPGLPGRWRDIFDLDLFRDADPNRIHVISRLVLHADARRSLVLGRLLSSLYEYAREQDGLGALMYCAPKLAGMYEQLGFRRYTDNFNLSEAGAYRIPMVLDVTDQEHLRRVRSPLLRAARKFPPPPPTSASLTRMLPGVNRLVNARLMSEDELFSRIALALLADAEETPEIFRGLPEDAIRLVLQKCVLLDVKQGDRIIRQGNLAEEMFLAMEGVFEVTLDVDDQPVSLQLLGPGEIFGELSFLRKTARSADVWARTDGQILIFNEDFLDRMHKGRPEIGLSLVRNLLSILARRLSATDVRITELVSRNPWSGVEET